MLLALAVRVPAIVVTRMTLTLQLAASSLAETILNTFSVPVLREGNILVFANATLQVAEACSGLRFIVALTTMAVVVARVAHPGTIQRCSGRDRRRRLHDRGAPRLDSATIIVAAALGLRGFVQPLMPVFPRISRTENSLRD